MYCQKCGKQIADGSVFCQYCGAQIGNVVSDNFSNQNANQNFNVQHTEKHEEPIKNKEEFIADFRAKTMECRRHSLRSFWACHTTQYHPTNVTAVTPTIIQK